MSELNSLNRNTPINNVLYAQAGGVTSVINASAAAVIESVLAQPETFGKIYAALEGIQGLLEEELVDLSHISPHTIEALKHQPAAAFHSCRFDLEPLEHSPAQYERILAIFKHYHIVYFFYNGGNGSMLTALKISDYCRQHGHSVTCVGVAKTIDNDIDLSHCSPGFGSAAKYIASSFLEATLDIACMHRSSTKFFAMETMGRNTGWLTISAALIKDVVPDVPMIVLPAERPFEQDDFLKKVAQLISDKGYCVCAVSEGLQDESGSYITISDIEHTYEQDYSQLGGVAQTVAHIVNKKLGYKTHCAIPDILQRSCSHMVSATDWRIAYGAGKAAVQAAINGEHGVLPIVKLTPITPFQWTFETVPLETVANIEKHVPNEYLSEDGMDVTAEALAYLRPLIQGERPIPFKNGLPNIPEIQFQHVHKKLPKFMAVK
ncbi:MAG: ATP-dependent phosphofructokinase/diphosphate-dependent phosphofructokinase [Thiomicrorhabdus sp.]|nr:MAG: ATP-dependent phosphofructokinase/diphosphate-dependent phosphofructokinase [Thiomicrorhabdus sp.]